MGTEISLDIAGYSVAWSKNSIGVHHGSLFQESDRQIIPNVFRDGYVDIEPDEPPLTGDWGFMRTLGEALPRLEMLGFTLARAEQEYQLACENALQSDQEMREYMPDKDPLPTLLTFEEFLKFLLDHPLRNFSPDYVKSFDSGVLKPEALRHDRRVRQVPGADQLKETYYSHRTFFGVLIDILSSYSTLRVLATVPENCEEELVWHYGPLCENGWATIELFTAGARREERFLIATEGTSDIAVLNHAINLMKPGIADFFHFIDSERSHPFTGAGNLKRLAEGLAKIDVQNRTVIVFDNDTEGVDACADVDELDLPRNMTTFVLPDLLDFEALPIRGPDGVKISDLNGRAIAIKCYLDLEKGPDPTFNWTDRKKSSGNFQGTLQTKEKYLKPFLKLRATDLAKGHYEISKIEAVLSALVNCCVGIAERCNEVQFRD